MADEPAEFKALVPLGDAPDIPPDSPHRFPLLVDKPKRGIPWALIALLCIVFMAPIAASLRPVVKHGKRAVAWLQETRAVEDEPQVAGPGKPDLPFPEMPVAENEPIVAAPQPESPHPNLFISIEQWWDKTRPDELLSERATQLASQARAISSALSERVAILEARRVEREKMPEPGPYVEQAIVDLVSAPPAPAPEMAEAIKILDNRFVKPSVEPTPEPVTQTVSLTRPELPAKLVKRAEVHYYNPSDAVRWAAWDLKTNVPAQDWLFQRYVSLYHLPNDKLDREARMMAFTANSVSTVRTISLPQPVPGQNGRLFRLDIRWYDWPAQAWEKLGDNQAYFQDQWTAGKPLIWMKGATQSNHPVVRSDDFTYRVLLEDQPTTPLVDGFYVDFLQLGKDENDFLRRFGVDREAVEENRSYEGGSVIWSGVTNHNRRLSRFPTTYSRNGYHWISYDVLSNTKNESVVAKLFDDLEAVATEQIGKLRNGGQYYGVFDLKNNGKRLAQADINVAHDKHFDDAIVWSARSCIGCHAVGINPYENTIKTLSESRKWDVKSDDYRVLQKAAEFYLTDTDKAIAIDQESYAQFLLDTTEWSPGEFRDNYVKAFKEARYSPVTLQMAATDMGVSVDECEEVLRESGEPKLLAIRAGQEMPRDAWEDAFEQAMLLRIFVKTKKGLKAGEIEPVKAQAVKVGY